MYLSNLKLFDLDFANNGGSQGESLLHDSGHTFGTLMLSAGIPIESISKMMRHTSIRTIQIYARITDDKISEDMDRLMEKREIQN